MLDDFVYVFSHKNCKTSRFYNCNISVFLLFVVFYQIILKMYNNIIHDITYPS